MQRLAINNAFNSVNIQLLYKGLVRDAHKQRQKDKGTIYQSNVLWVASI